MPAASPQWVTILSPLLSGLFALLGVIAGGIFQFLLAERSARRQRLDRLRDEQRAADEKLEAKSISRAFPAMLVARHLESYALDCAKTITANSDDYEPRYEGFPTFKEWPDIDWRLLGAADTILARDFETKISLHGDWVDGQINYAASDEQEAAEYYSNASARAGWEAWEIAKGIRKRAGLKLFEFDVASWDYPATLKARLDEIERRWRATLIAQAAQREMS